jgi:HPt (histidine-containing phosphotransfer) domain-containing protein
MFLSNGFDGFISKPIIAAELNQALYEFLPRGKIRLADHAEANAVHKEDLAVQGNNSREKGGSLWESLASIEGLDIEAGLEHCNNDRDFYLRTLQSAASHLPSECASLQKEYDAGDWKAFGIRSHGLKSVFATIGARNLSDEGKRFEFAAKEGRFDECKDEGQSFINAVSAFGIVLKSVLDASPSGMQSDQGKTAPQAQNHMFVHDRIAALISALEEANTKAVKANYGELNRIFVRLDIDNVKELIDNYDYEEAAKLLQRSLDNGHRVLGT